MKTVTERTKFAYKCQNCSFENYKEKTPSGLSVTKLGNYGDNATPQPEEFAEEMLLGTTISFTAAGEAIGGRLEEDDESRLLESGILRSLEDSSSDTTSSVAIFDSLSQFRDARFQDAMFIRIESDSGTNDGDYKIASRGVSRSEILLEDEYSLTTETAEAAGTVKISRLLYKPNITEGCPFCGTLNSRRAYGFQDNR